ncbi:hypothetical protein SDC9_106344 [bioreactor metagenome]|uniref:Uncharacterized protein n=1 Tax=bioreactor metagenome TaxID=1076179 RepID=A0A645B228_9ZZZZ
MSLFFQVGEKLQKKRKQQQADVHTIGIGIGGYDDLIVAQPLHFVLDVERRL